MEMKTFLEKASLFINLLTVLKDVHSYLKIQDDSFNELLIKKWKVLYQKKECHHSLQILQAIFCYNLCRKLET